MTKPGPALRAFLCGALALGLAGCVTLLPKTEPAQLYTFGFAQPPAEAEQAPAQGGALASPAATLALAPIGFVQAARGDAILTLSGAEAAYLAQTRWVSPAHILFQEAANDALSGARGLRLAPRRQLGAADHLLRLDVRAFQTEYGPRGRGAPTVVVRVQASLSERRSDRLLAERVFEVRTPASANRVSAIVGAYNRSVSETLSQITDWTRAELAAPLSARPLEQAAPAPAASEAAQASQQPAAPSDQPASSP